ncbi:MAG: phosphoribosylformylglycinamidine synthase subunit PurL [Peptococcaceae bacterium]|mgnify:CR=1 FL=1|nr:phosphoribosylformylglycinamidine synthase subunit PurL [Peptococcaceae bacterium]
MIQEVRVMVRDSIPDSKGDEVLFDIHQALGINSVEKVRTAKVFRFEGISENTAFFLANKLLAEDIFQSFRVNSKIIDDADFTVEVAYKPGVMNPEAASLMKSASDLGIDDLIAADSAWEYGFYGEKVTEADIEHIVSGLLVNATVQYVVKESPKTLIIQGNSGHTETIPIGNMNDQQLIDLSKDKLFLNLEEMKVIQSYFRSLDRDPTDCEIEIIAQTWSEHCGHKTFRAKLIVDGEEKKPLLQRLSEATKESKHPLVLSAFVDNSGVMDFYDGMAVCGKVETHNSPSAIEPYGGAMTGSGGVFRDIAGTGLGAKVIASTNMFCLAPPGLPADEIPPGCLQPHYLLRRVIAGIRDYGNRMGVPTNNGSLHFHRDYRAKPTVIAGAYGILPAAGCQKGQPKKGDRVVAMGGRTGRDGIHGATFSSGEMTDRTIDVNASAVQIGHPIEEKRMFDAILAAGNESLIRAITDCGAGGFASAVGEMGAETGVHIALDLVPLKYPGLSPWEILLSESQERMVLAIAPDHVERLLEICRNYNVEATILGEFTDDGHFTATYGEQQIMHLDMGFLHDGLPQRVLKAAWKNPQLSSFKTSEPADWPDLYKKVMRDLDICSKEPIVKMYDHGVQGTNALPPFSGVHLDGPNDAAILTPILGKPYGLVISHGLNPILNRIDPYYGSIWAATEAVSNAVACGANPNEMVLIDNFIWPFPDEEQLGALDMAVDACVDFVQATGMPFISGKDSLSSTYRSQDGTVIKIPPVLCVSAFGRIPDVARTVSADFKKAGNHIVLLGYRDTKEMAGSTYNQIHGTLGSNLPRINLDNLTCVLQTLYRAISLGQLEACHDLSEGGLAAALAEMCFGGDVGAVINIQDDENPVNFLFNETAGCFLAELPTGLEPAAIFDNIPCRIIGVTSTDKKITVKHSGRELFTLTLNALKTAWQQPMKEVFR